LCVYPFAPLYGLRYSPALAYFRHQHSGQPLQCPHRTLRSTDHNSRSITWDWEHGFNLEWDSLEDFHNWCKHKQWAHGIKLRTAHTKRPHGSSVFSGSQLFVCARQGTSGTKVYEKKTKREAKESKHIIGGCPCLVRIKLYPHTRTILGKYAPDHSHPTGKDNLKYVQIRIPTLEQIAGLIRLGLSDWEIVRDIYLSLDDNLI
jgi:hypothetical protein